MIESITVLIEAVRARGIELVATGSELRFHPVERMTADLLARLREHKREIVETLQRDADVGEPDEVVPALAKARNDLRAIAKRKGLLIGCPSPYLIVRGTGFASRLVPAQTIPAEAFEYHLHGDDWRPIPEHWRGSRESAG